MLAELSYFCMQVPFLNSNIKDATNRYNKSIT